MNSTIRAVTFDIGGTLLEPWPSVGHVYAEVAAGQGVPGLAPAELNRQFAAAWKARPQFDYTREHWAQLVAETFAGVLPEPVDGRLFAALYQRFTEPDAWHVFDDVRPTLAALRQAGFRLAAISNWDERLRPLLDRLGLLEHFEGVLVSCEVGCRKPAPEIFRLAAARLGLSPAQILHVGDSAEADVRGARGAGFAAIQLSRHAPHHHGSGSIATLAELSERLRR